MPTDNLNRGHSSIQSYHRGFKYGVSFDQTDTSRPYMGVEIEIGSIVPREQSALKIYEKINRGFEFVTIEKDGSISQGFEVITQPLNVEKLLEIGEYIFGELKDQSERFTNQNAGLHVHVPKQPGMIAREAFTNDRFIYRRYGRNLCYLILNNKYRNDIRKFSRRTSFEYCQFPSLSTFYPSDSHYAAVGDRANTFEIRIFRGTTNFSEYKSTILFVEKVMTIAIRLAKKGIDLVDMNNTNLIPDFSFLLDETGRQIISR